MIIGFNPDYPALHILKGLELITSGKAADFGWDADDIKDIVGQADLLISERGKSLTQHELSKLNALLDLVKRMTA